MTMKIKTLKLESNFLVTIQEASKVTNNDFNLLISFKQLHIIIS